MSAQREPSGPVEENNAGARSKGTANSGAETKDEREKLQQESHASGKELKQRLDQVGTILAKGLDLAEAGISLGVTIISRVGVAAQQRIREAAPSVMPKAPETQQAADAQSASDAEPEPAYGITNRLPAMAGSTVKISFSINNDSMTEPKKVDLTVEGFTGDTQGGRLDASAFTVKPAQKTIAPVDFEKFILQGPVPADAVPDVYRGVVRVASENELRIPVVLVVMPL